MVFGASINSCLDRARPAWGAAAGSAGSPVHWWPQRVQPGQGAGQRTRKAPGALARHSSLLPHCWMLLQPAMLLGGLLLLMATMTGAQQRGQEAGGRRRAHRVQHGQCSYTFVLPEPEPCPPEPEAFGGSNSLQRDSPATVLNLEDWPTQRVRQLEKVLENNTQWLQKVSWPCRGGSGWLWAGGASTPGAFLGTEGWADGTLVPVLYRLG